MNEIPAAKDGSPLYEGQSRFGVTGGNLICGGIDNSPERIAQRRSYATMRLVACKSVCKPIFRSATRKPILRSVRKKQGRELRRWQGCLDRMKNGDPGMRAEWAMQFEDALKNLSKTFEAFKDSDGNPIWEDLTE